MSISTDTFARKPFHVEAVQVTPENMADVAEWCEGTIHSGKDGARYIKVNVLRPLNARQTKAFVGDWVLAKNNAFKVYTESAFEKTFDPFNAE